MAIAYDATSGANRNWVTSDSFSHTCTGDDRLLLVWVFFDRGAGTYNASNVNYSGVELTKYATFTDTSRYAELWYLANPASGANTLAATYNNAGPTAKVLIRAVSYTGVDAATPMGTLVSAYAASGTTASVVASSASGEVVADFVWVFSGGQSLTVGADQTSRVEIEEGTTGYGAFGWSDEPGAASVTMSWSFLTDRWMIGSVPIKPTGTVTSVVPKTTKQTLLGVG